MFRFLAACAPQHYGRIIQVKLSKRKQNSNVQIRLTASAYSSRYDLPTIDATTRYRANDICIAIQETSKRFKHIERQKLHRMHCTAFTECVFACTKQFVINANRRQGARMNMWQLAFGMVTFAALIHAVSRFTAKKKKKTTNLRLLPLYEDDYLH